MLPGQKCDIKDGNVNAPLPKKVRRVYFMHSKVSTYTCPSFFKKSTQELSMIKGTAESLMVF